MVALGVIRGHKQNLVPSKSWGLILHFYVNSLWTHLCHSQCFILLLINIVDLRSVETLSLLTAEGAKSQSF